MLRLKQKKSLVQGRNTRRMAVIKPQLTSLIDVMTILLVFLLKSFSVDGNLIQVSPNINLPESSSEKKPIATLNIEVNLNTIAVDGRTVLKVSEVEKSDSLMLTALYDALHQVSNSGRFISGDGRVLIQCDSAMDFRILKKVMYTCGKARFANFSLLVREDIS